MHIFNYEITELVLIYYIYYWSSTMHNRPHCAKILSGWQVGGRALSKLQAKKLTGQDLNQGITAIPMRMKYMGHTLISLADITKHKLENGGVEELILKVEDASSAFNELVKKVDT